MKATLTALTLMVSASAFGLSITEMASSLESGKKVSPKALEGIKKEYCQDMKKKTALGSEVFRLEKNNFEKLRVGTTVTYTVSEFDQKSGKSQLADVELWTLAKKTADEAIFNVSNMKGQTFEKTIEKPAVDLSAEVQIDKPLTCLFFEALYHKIQQQEIISDKTKLHAIRYERQGFGENGYFIVSGGIPLSRVESSQTVDSNSGHSRTLIRKVESYHW